MITFILRQNRSFTIFIVILIFSFPVLSQRIIPNPGYHLIDNNDFVASKNFYVLTLFRELPDVKKLLSVDKELSDLGKIRVDSLTYALKNCARNGVCYIERMKFTDAEIETVSKRLANLYEPQNALGKLVSNQLIPSGRYILFQDLPAKEMLVKAWEQDAKGINFCIDVYAGGSKPNYPLIDSNSFNTKDPRANNAYLNSYVSLIYNATSLVSKESNANESFYDPSLTLALLFLEMNERNQAADFEPMEEGENRPACNKIKTIKWNEYKYSVILVPGAGPEEPAVSLSAEGMIRCRLAALEYEKGLAPFIMTSGGKVHPYKTKFCEALEMKKYLIEKLHVPENAIIIEPHARHTTTNMRNAARLIFRYRIPFDKPGITCTTKGQSSWIGTTLTDRCMKELKEIPYKSGARLDENVIEFFPLVEALQINPLEPIDP